MWKPNLRIVRTWRLAVELEKAADRGDATLHVPMWLMPELRQLIWMRRAERVQERWEDRTAEVSLQEWYGKVMGYAERQESNPDQTEHGTP